MCDSISRGGVWTLTVTVQGPCLWRVCCSAKTLQSPSICFQNAKQLTIPAEAPVIFIVVIHFPSFHTYVNFMSEDNGCQLLFCSMGMMLTFLLRPFLWDVDDNSSRDANTSHHLQNYFPALQRFSVVHQRVIGRGKTWCHVSCYASAMSSGRWWCDDDVMMMTALVNRWSRWWWQWGCNLSSGLFPF